MIHSSYNLLSLYVVFSSPVLHSFCIINGLKSRICFSGHSSLFSARKSNMQREKKMPKKLQHHLKTNNFSVISGTLRHSGISDPFCALQDPPVLFYSDSSPFPEHKLHVLQICLFSLLWMAIYLLVEPKDSSIEADSSSVQIPHKYRKKITVLPI